MRRGQTSRALVGSDRFTERQGFARTSLIDDHIEVPPGAFTVLQDGQSGLFTFREYKREHLLEAPLNRLKAFVHGFGALIHVALEILQIHPASILASSRASSATAQR